MKNHKQITVKNSVIETLDRIRKQLPLRGNVLASYGDAITWLDGSLGVAHERIAALESDLRICVGQKKARK